MAADGDNKEPEQKKGKALLSFSRERCPCFFLFCGVKEGQLSRRHPSLRCCGFQAKRATMKRRKNAVSASL